MKKFKSIVEEVSSDLNKYLLVNVTELDYLPSKVRLISHKELGWCLKPSILSDTILTAVELRDIADKIDEYNKNK